MLVLTTKHRSFVILTAIYLSLILVLIWYHNSSSILILNGVKQYVQDSVLPQSHQPSQEKHFPYNPPLDQVADAEHPRHVTTFRLCQPADHYGPNARETREHWPKVFMPSGQPDPNQDFQERFNNTFYSWKFYELQISPEKGEIRVPLIRGYQQDSWKVDWFADHDIAWLRSLTQAQSITCTIHYADNTVRRSRFHVSARGDPYAIISPEPRPWGGCATDYFKAPVSIDLSLTDHSQPESSVFHQQTVHLPICEFTTPVYYVVAEIKSLFSFNVDELIDWMSYHYTIGIDHFFVHYRYFLSEEQQTKLAPLVEGGLLTLERFPIEHEMKERFDWHTDQDELLEMFTLRVAKHATWIMATDFDEYLRIQNVTYYQRECNNSIYCPSPIRDWLDDHRGYFQIQFDTVVVVPDAPPAEKRLLEDAYRYAPDGRDPVHDIALPIPVRRVWQRSFAKMDSNLVVNHNKVFYQVDYMSTMATHGGSGIRHSYRDRVKSNAYLYHYHAYPIWEELDHISHTLTDAQKLERTNKYWKEEAVRDTYVSDVFERIQWPKGSNQQMFEKVRPYQGKHTLPAPPAVRTPAVQTPAVETKHDSS